ncbi:THxN family PEP-CTERM protein [Paracoccus sp. 11-3]|uniref:THxN family PEP-CTERM protein n=1 Tax=Paracoccus amoyensis TaxID=2760093 RepID=A0A926GBU5_9RHOB|nr:THxN family PEP-CTERM protein [Paracoccus amoyensis]
MAAFAVVFAAVSANASTLTLTNVAGNWSSWTGGVSVTPSTRDEVSELRWGTPRFVGKQSGYDFKPAEASSTHQEDETFALGLFTHHNFPIDVGITSATLDVTFSFYLGEDTDNIYTRTSQFVFSHIETPNMVRVCSNGKRSRVNGVQVGCEDRVTPVTNPSKSEVFTVVEGNKTHKYMFDVTGFDIGDGFWTVENQKNTATLQGRFTYEENVAPIPLPAAGWMLLAGLGGIGAVARRRRNS